MRYSSLSLSRLLLNHMRSPLSLSKRNFSRSSLPPSQTTALTYRQTLANERPQDIALQESFFPMLALSHPEQAIQRFESGRFAISPLIVQSYLSALERTNTFDKLTPLQVKSLMEQTSPSTSSSSPDISSESTAAIVAQVTRDLRRQPLQVSVTDQKSTSSQIWKTIRSLGTWFILMTGAGAIIDSQMSGITSGRGVGGLSSSTKPNVVVDCDTRFTDIKGCDEAKDELEEVVDFLRHPDRLTRLGGKMPKGVLIYGPPGTGKTLLARAVAGEAGVPFFYASGSEFEELYVGVGARRVRDLFEAAKAQAPCIVFIDEIDAIGGSRKMKDHQSMRMTLNQLLVEMDGFSPSDSVIVIGATNFSELLDKALVRPGRFDRHVVVPLPDMKGRKEIFDLYVEKIQISSDVDTSILARGTPGCTGADIANIVNQAAVKASLDKKNAVSMKEFEFAKDKILMGSERKSNLMSEEEKKLTAYHEGGHALIAMKTEGALPIHKATIMPRGQALGMVHQLPEKDVVSMSYKQLLARLDVCMGGRVAEEMIFGKENVTTGASSDIQQATRLASSMVMKYGMSERVGVLDAEERDLATIAPQTKRIMDEEIQRLLQESYGRAQALLKRYEKELHRVARGLLEYETLTKEELERVVRGEQLKK